MVGGATLGTTVSSWRGGWILCSAVIFKRGMILVGTTPSIQDGRLNGWGDPGGVTGSVESIGEDELLVVSFREPVLDGLESLDLNPPPPLPRFFLKLRWRLIQFPLGFSHLLRASISGSLLHFSRVRINVFLRKYFLLWTYLEMASAHACLQVNLAHSSAHRPLPWSLLFGLAAGKNKKSIIKTCHTLTTFLNIGLQFLASGLSISHEIRRISGEIHPKPYKIRCFNKNYSVWWMQERGYDLGSHEIWGHSPPPCTPPNWIVFVETSDFIRFGVDFTGNPPDFMVKSAGFHLKSARFHECELLGDDQV